MSLERENKWNVVGCHCIDGNYGLFPIAHAIVEVVSGKSWHWFLLCLTKSLGDVPNVTFISDRAKGLYEAIFICFSNIE